MNNKKRHIATRAAGNKSANELMDGHVRVYVHVCVCVCVCVCVRERERELASLLLSLQHRQSVNWCRHHDISFLSAFSLNNWVFVCVGQLGWSWYYFRKPTSTCLLPLPHTQYRRWLNWLLSTAAFWSHLMVKFHSGGLVFWAVCVDYCTVCKCLH